MRKSTSRRLGKVHCVIPDCQVKPGVDISYLNWIGNYINEKKPNVLINIGDFNDLVSLNSYAIGKAEAEGTRYSDDIRYGKEAMAKLLNPINKANKGAKVKYSPEMHLTLGNHEFRAQREAESNPKLLGTISLNDLGYKEFGWKVHDFLKVVKIDGIEYCHYFTSGVLGRPVSSAAALLRERQNSAVMGHVQKLDIAIHPKTQNVALFAGLINLHDEGYLGPQGNNIKRGIWMLNQVENGTFDPMFVSLAFLKQNYS